MSVEKKLESYLTSLDKALNKISIGDRADIITEIKSHVLMTKEKNPEQSIESILSSLGEPETVANKYLIERGLKPGKASKSPMIKWLTIGFLGTFGISCLMLLILIWNFSPLIYVDEKNERVQLLGGMIDVDGNEGRVKVGSSYVQSKGKKFKGALPVKMIETKEIKIQFDNGKMDIGMSADEQLRWECKLTHIDEKTFINKDKEVLLINLKDIDDVNCDLELPKGIKAVINGANGKLDLSKPLSEIEIEMANGKVDIEPEASAKYKYDLKIKNGLMDEFVSSNDKDAILVKVNLVNGAIKLTE